MTVSEYIAGVSAYGERLEGSLASCVAAPVMAVMERCIAEIRRTRKHGGVVHLIGNGGSASLVAHAHNDLVKACQVRALVHQDIPLLTACANDEGYIRAYANPVRTWMESRDVLIAVSSSGMSGNILEAVDVACEHDAVVMTLTGCAPSNALRSRGHMNFYVPSENYGHIELTHAALLHYLTDELAHA